MRRPRSTPAPDGTSPGSRVNISAALALLLLLGGVAITGAAPKARHPDHPAASLTASPGAKLGEGEEVLNPG